MTVIPGESDGFDVDLVIPPNDQILQIEIYPADVPNDINLTLDGSTDEMNLVLGGDGPLGPAGPTGPAGEGTSTYESVNPPVNPRPGDVWIKIEMEPVTPPDPTNLQVLFDPVALQVQGLGLFDWENDYGTGYQFQTDSVGTLPELTPEGLKFTSIAPSSRVRLAGPFSTDAPTAGTLYLYFQMLPKTISADSNHGDPVSDTSTQRLLFERHSYPAMLQTLRHEDYTDNMPVPDGAAHAVAIIADGTTFQMNVDATVNNVVASKGYQAAKLAYWLLGGTPDNAQQRRFNGYLKGLMFYSGKHNSTVQGQVRSFFTNGLGVTSATRIPMVWDGEDWQETVPGPVGPMGPIGGAGPTGPLGPTGPAGPTGPIGLTGPTGSQGVSGYTWLSGTTAPSGAIGQVNDFYLNTVSGYIYKKTSPTVWSVQMQLAAPMSTATVLRNTVLSVAIPNAAFTQITPWDTLIQDSNGLVPVLANGPVAPRTGLYLVSGNVGIANASGAPGLFHIEIRAASDTRRVVRRSGWAATSPTTASFAHVVQLSAGENPQIWVYQTSGAAVNIYGGVDYETSLSLTELTGVLGPTGPTGPTGPPSTITGPTGAGGATGPLGPTGPPGGQVVTGAGLTGVGSGADPLRVTTGAVRRLGAGVRTTNGTNMVGGEQVVCTFRIPLARTGRTYRVMGSYNILPDTAGMFTEMIFKYGVGASATVGTAFGGGFADHRIVGRSQLVSAMSEFTYTGADNATDIDVVMTNRAAGGGSYPQCSSARPGIMTVDEIL